MKINIRFLGFASLLVLLLSFTLSVSLGRADGAAIWTDKEDYSPEETVIIYGTGFAPNTPITVNVTRPDGHVDSSLDEGEHVVHKVTVGYGLDGTGTVDESDGSFRATYVLDGILGEYTVVATDGTNTATTIFTDADIDYVSVSPSSMTITAGDTTTYTVTVAKKGGSELSVNLSIVGSLPSGSSATFDPNPVTFSSGESGTKTSTLTIKTSESGSTGTFNFIVKGTKTGTGNTANSNQVSLIVQVPTFSVTFDATTSPGLPADVADSTEVLTVTIGSGSPVSVIKADLPKNFTGIASGTTITYSYNSPLASTIDGKQYRWDSTSGTGSAYGQTGQSGSFSLISTSTVTGTYVTQYKLTMATNFGTTSPTLGEHWYDAGTVLTISATAPSVGDGERYDWNGWTGTGTGSYSGTDNPATNAVTMNGPITETASWTRQYRLTIQTIGLSSASYPTNVKLGGSTVGTAYDSSPYTQWFDSGASTETIGVDDTVSGDTDTQFVFTKWNEDSSTNNPRASVTMDIPKTFTAVYKTKYLVTFGWSGLDIDASGTVVTITVRDFPVVKNAGDGFYSEWLDAGTTLSYSFKQLVSSSMPNKAYKLVSVAGTSTSASHNFGSISGPISETGNYGSIILSITKKAPSAVFVGDTVRYVYEVENTGTTSATGIAVSDGSLTVTFVGGDANGNGKLDPKETWVYTATYGPVSATGSITNTAQVSCNEGAVAEDTATVNVYQLQVSKTAVTSYNRTYTWTISKTANPSSLIFSSGTATQTVDYSIVLSATYTDSDWKVTGTINITNPAPIDAVITGIADIVSPDIKATIDFSSAGVTFPYTLKAGKTLELTYSADLPDATSRVNNVTVTMQNYERPFLWDLTGDWVIRVYYGGTYDHDFTLTMASDGLAFKGTGGYPASGPPYLITETINGVTAVNDVFWHSVYNNGYFWDAKGTIASDGKMSGTWTSSASQAGTWESTQGAAALVQTTTGTSDISGQADVVFGDPDEIDESVTVTDTYSGGPQDKVVAYPGDTLTYQREIGPYANIGIYTVENTAQFVTCDTKTKKSADCTVTVYRTGSAVTTSSFYLFDYDAAEGRQFKLILTPDVPTNPNLYRVTATNPGQFYYNIFYYGTLTISTTFTIMIPDPFVTQGANPVHIYDSISTSGDYLLPAGNDITSKFTITPTYSATGDFTGFTITPNEAYEGPVYITIHLDYGYKKTLGGLGKDNSNNALDGATGPIKIKDLTDYTFSVSGPLTDSDTIQNRNVFKRDPGFVGLVTDSEGNPIAGVKVQIYGPDGKLLATVYTDKDGWYSYNYKYTGKAATFTIKLSEYSKTATVTIKSNSLTKIDFVIP